MSAALFLFYVSSTYSLGKVACALSFLVIHLDSSQLLVVVVLVAQVKIPVKGNNIAHLTLSS